MARRKRRRRKPQFEGFGQLQNHPVLVGMNRDLAPRPEEATGGIVVHELESAAPVDVGTSQVVPTVAAVGPAPARGRYHPVAVGGFLPDGRRARNPDLSGVTSFGGGGGALVSQGGVVTAVPGTGPSSAPSGAPGPGGRGGRGDGPPGDRPGGRGRGRGRGRRRHHRRHHRRRPWQWWSWLPYYSSYGSWGPAWQPGLPLPGDCERPLSADCTRFRVTRQWAVVCFMGAYNRMRQLYGPNLQAVARAITEAEAPGCGGSNTSSAREFRRRVELATAVLMRSEGINVPVPPAPSGERPSQADQYQQAWMRALMVGWV